MIDDPPTAWAFPRWAWIALIRARYRDDPYARLLHLWNAGYRGADLR